MPEGRTGDGVCDRCRLGNSTYLQHMSPACDAGFFYYTL